MRKKLKPCRIRRFAFLSLVFSCSIVPVLYVSISSTPHIKRDSSSTVQQEIRHIAYIKVHKTASSSIQNIFFRFGFDRNLTFVLPSADSIFPNVISISDTINEKNIRPPPLSESFDISCLHVSYNRTAFGRVLPNDTIYIGSLRDPFDQFMSAMLYFRMFKHLKIQGPNAITDFLKDPENHDYTISDSKYAFFSYTKNRMAIDFGFPKDVIIHQRKDDIQAHIEKLNKEIALVMISEHFDESIVLLKRILKWSVKDILYVRKNDNSNKNKSLVTDEDDRNRYRNLSVIDHTLYEYFYLKLWRQINREVMFHEEVLYFKAIRNNVEKHCLSRISQDFISSDLTIPKSYWNEEFKISAEFCTLLLMRERNFVIKIRDKQYGRS